MTKKEELEEQLKAKVVNDKSDIKAKDIKGLLDVNKPIETKEYFSYFLFLY